MSTTNWLNHNARHNTSLFVLWLASSYGVGCGVGKLLLGTGSLATVAGVLVLIYTHGRADEILNEREAAA